MVTNVQDKFTSGHDKFTNIYDIFGSLQAHWNFGQNSNLIRHLFVTIQSQKNKFL